MEDSKLSEKAIGCAIKVHTELGPGLLESSYLECLAYELVDSGLLVEKQKPLPLVYGTVKLEIGYRIDLLVEKRLVIEVKSVEAVSDVHVAQLLTCLRLNKNRYGLLKNFNVSRMKDGIRRVVNGY